MDAIFKFNNGNIALLCSKCRTIIKTGIELSNYEFLAFKGNVELASQYCTKCSSKCKKIKKCQKKKVKKQ